MTLAASRLRRSFLMHGVRLEVRADDPAVVEAMQLRLRDFSTDHSTAAELVLEFTGSVPPPPEDVGRPVYDTPHGSLRYFPEAGVLRGQLGGVWLHCEPGRGSAVLAAKAFAGRELYFATHPLATVSLMELLERHGRFSLHAACLAGDGERGVLLSGPSGSGKSTLALALAQAGMSFLGDDVLFLAPREGGRVRALGFADTIGVSAYAAEIFPKLLRRLGQTPAEGFPKPLGRIEQLLGRSAPPSCDPCALVFPEVVRQRPSQLSRLDPGEALLRLTPDVLLTDPASTQAHLGAIGALLEQVDCYRLSAGPDLETAAALVKELVRT